MTRNSPSIPGGNLDAVTMPAGWADETRDHEGELEPTIDPYRVFVGLLNVWDRRIDEFLNGQTIDANDLERLGIQIASTIGLVQSGGR